MSNKVQKALVDALAATDDGEAPPVPETELFAELALWSATADGVLEDVEIVDLSELLRGIPGLAHFDVPAANKLVDTMAEKYATEEAIAGRIAELALALSTPALKRASYQLALWSAARDGHFTENETDFLEALQDCLGITDDVARELLRQTIEVDAAYDF